MKTRSTLLSTVLTVLTFYGCKKSSTKPASTDPLASLYGTWQTTDLGGAGDTARMSITSSSTNAYFTYVSAATMNATASSVNIAVFQTISATGSNTFDMQYPFRYGMNNSYSSITDGTLTLLTSTTLLATPAKDPFSNTTPAISHWVKLP